VTAPSRGRPRLLFVVNEAYFFVSHRLAIARAARDAGFEVHLATPTDNVWAPTDYDARALAAEGISFHPIPLERRGRDPVADFRTFVALLRLFRRLRPDIVHLVTIKPVLYGGLAARLSRVRAAVSAVSGLGQIFTARGPHAAVLRWLICRVYAVATAHPNGRVIVQNGEDAERLASAGAVARERLVLIRGSGADLVAFAPRAEPDGTVTVLFASRLLWEKGVGEFVAAARRLKAQGVAACFVIAGNTTTAIASAVPESRLLAWVEEGSVAWWGRCADMPAVIASAHIVCLPSRYGEGVPKILIEAAAAGRPIIATDIAGCREIVGDGDNGILVAPGDSTALADAIMSLVDDPARRRRMGERGRAIACAGFGEQAVVERTLELYAELLGAA
jgi:glycosyltransferase involved in cell wall biosynthesis